MKRLEELDLEGLCLLDGAMATELERRGCDLSGPLWSAQVLESAPGLVATVHREYLEAGADCLVSASYQVSEEGFREVGRGPAAAAQALRTAVEIAIDARNAYQARRPRKIWIAAGLGPYGAALHNGAEYHGNYSIGFEELVAFHNRRLAILQETSADFVAFETIPSEEEARAVLVALGQFPSLAACISFTCRDSRHLAHGESLRATARLLNRERQVVAIGVNCVHPRLVLPLIEELVSATGKPSAVYPNSGEIWDAARRCWTGESAAGRFAEMALEWRAAGAQWIGGCCRTGPEQIRAMAKALQGR